MIKSEFVIHIASKFRQLPEKDVELCINKILEQFSDALASGQRIEIRGFGSFSLHHHTSRKAHNPKTGEQVTTPSKNTVYFKVGKKIRALLSNAYIKKTPILQEDTHNHDISF